MHLAKSQLVCSSVSVKVLQAISDNVKNLNWKVRQRSCNGDGGFDNRNISGSQVTRNVTCDCSFNISTVCHVTNM